MLHECQTADEVRALARAQQIKRRKLYAPSTVIVDIVDNLPVVEPVAVEIVEMAQETRVPVRRQDPIDQQEPEPRGVIVYPSLARIVEAVGDKFGITRADIISQRRTLDVVLPRQIAMYLARTLTLLSLPVVGKHIGGRDHSTVMFAVRKITRLRKTDLELDATLSEFESMLKARFHSRVAPE